MANCPLCTDVLLRHIRSGQTYWFCRRCRLEITEPTHQPAFSIADLVHPEVEETPPLTYHNLVSDSLLTPKHAQDHLKII